MLSDVVGVVYAASPATPSVSKTGVLVVVLAVALGRLVVPSAARPTAQRGDQDRIPARSDRQQAAGWDNAAWDALAGRLSLLTCAFLAAVVPRKGRPTCTDTSAPVTLSFMAALERATTLLLMSSLDDSPAEFAAAVDEAERRWNRVQALERLRPDVPRAADEVPDDGA